MEDTLKRLGGAMDEIRLSKAIEPAEEARTIFEDTPNICRGQIEAFA
jgi:hypothetical protein